MGTEEQRRGQEGLGGLSPQALKLAPPPATYELAYFSLPHNIFACWRFSHSRVGAAILSTLTFLNNAGTNFINYLLTCLLDTGTGTKIVTSL